MRSDRASFVSNSFSRTVENERKMGAYYTCLAICRIIRQLLKFSKEEETSVLEPSIGDGSAVIACTGADTNPNIKIFGVELADKVAEQTRNNPYIEDCLSADFTCGVKIKNQVFSFVFGNPPYMDDDDTDDGVRGRMEKTFLERVTGNYLKKDGIIVWVIPYRSFIDNSTLRYLLSHYKKLAVYKFWPEEYEKWHQIVFIGRKTASRMPLADEMAAERALYDSEDKVPELPRTFEGTELFESIEVPTSSSEEVSVFAPKELDPAYALNFLAGGPDIEDFNKMVSRHATQEEYTSSDLGRPPVRPKKDLVYLMETAGVGQGLAGEIGVDAHLQRGVAEVVEEAEYTEPEEGNHHSDGTVTVKTRTKVTMTIIETNSKITVLE